MTPESFNNHKIHSTLDSLERIFSDEELISKIDIEQLSFIQTAFSFIRERIKLTVPSLVQEAELNSIHKDLNEAVSQINTFNGNDNIGHINNAINSFNSGLNVVKRLPLPVGNSEYNFSKVISDFEETTNRKYKSLEKQKNDLSRALLSSEEKLKSQESEFERLNKLIESKENEIANLTSTLKTDFENIKSTHNQTFENNLKNFKNEFTKEKQEYNDEIKRLKEDIDSDTTSLIENLKKKLEEAEKLVNIIGNVGVTGNYQKIAENHKKSANFWRWAAIIFMVGFSAILVWTIFDLSSEGFNWVKSTIRLIAAAALSYPATYAARESSKHRRLETINRNAELELASINPFIENLSIEKKQEVKQKLVEKYFGNSKNNEFLDEKEIEVLSISTIERLISALVKMKS